MNRREEITEKKPNRHSVGDAIRKVQIQDKNRKQREIKDITGEDRSLLSPVRECVGGDDGSGHPSGAGTVAPCPQAACLPLG